VALDLDFAYRTKDPTSFKRNFCEFIEAKEISVEVCKDYTLWTIVRTGVVLKLLCYGDKVWLTSLETGGEAAINDINDEIQSGLGTVGGYDREWPNGNREYWEMPDHITAIFQRADG
jgi:hypothetical protein